MTLKALEESFDFILVIFFYYFNHLSYFIQSFNLKNLFLFISGIM